MLEEIERLKAEARQRHAEAARKLREEQEEKERASLEAWEVFIRAARATYPAIADYFDTTYRDRFNDRVSAMSLRALVPGHAPFWCAMCRYVVGWSEGEHCKSKRRFHIEMAWRREIEEEGGEPYLQAVGSDYADDLGDALLLAEKHNAAYRRELQALAQDIALRRDAMAERSRDGAPS